MFRKAEFMNASPFRPIRSRRAAYFALLSAAFISLSGSTLFLPIVPTLSTALRFSTSAGQLTIVAYNLGVAVGLIGFGRASIMLSRIKLLACAMLVAACAAIVTAAARSIEPMLSGRFVQGLASAAAPALVPTCLRLACSEDRAPRALAALSSVEAIAPAISPLAAMWMLRSGNWRLPILSFAAASTASAALIAILCPNDFGIVSERRSMPQGYGELFRNGRYLRLAASHALTTAGLLVIVAAAPFVFAHRFDRSPTYFALAQSSSIVAFIAAAQIAPLLASRTGEDRTVWWGTALALVAETLLISLSLADHVTAANFAVILIAINFGVGLRGPISFNRALTAAHGNESHGGAALVFAIMVASAAGVALTAPLVDRSLSLLALVATSMTGTACLLLTWPRHSETRDRRSWP